MDNPLRTAVFLDRDGVLIHDCGYPHRDEDMVLIDGASAAVSTLNRAGYLAIVVTNQSGVARGLFDEARMQAFHDLMTRTLSQAGARLDAIYTCPYHAEARVARYRHPDHPDRKPNPGMILRAVAEHGIDPARSHLIGDRDSDLQAAANAGVTGHLFKGGDLNQFVALLGLSHP